MKTFDLAITFFLAMSVCANSLAVRPQNSSMECKISVEKEKYLTEKIRAKHARGELSDRDMKELPPAEIKKVLASYVTVAVIHDASDDFGHGYYIYLDRSKVDGCLYLVYTGGFSGSDKKAFGPLY